MWVIQRHQYEGNVVVNTVALAGGMRRTPVIECMRHYAAEMQRNFGGIADIGTVTATVTTKGGQRFLFTVDEINTIIG